MTTDDLTALQALRAKMTPGEWQWRYDALGTDYPQWSIQPGILIADGTDGTPGGDMIDKANAAGIVALVNAAPALIASAARVAELEAEVAEWRECMQFDALMSGPVFKGWDRSQMERCRKKHEARATLGAA